MLFYSNNLDLLPPKSKLSFRYLKQVIQEFHRKYVLAPANKAANNVVDWPVGWGLTICLWLGPPLFNYWFSFTSAYSRISNEYLSLFIIVINLSFMFSL